MSLRDPKLPLQQMRDYAEQAKEIAASTTGRRIISQRRSQPDLLEMHFLSSDELARVF